MGLVALRKESVDRNCRNRFCPTCQWVALRKESVDRNGILRFNPLKTLMSLSARRAWIEMQQCKLKLS